MKTSRVIRAFALLAASACSTSFAQDVSCFERAQTNIEVDKCGSQLINPAEKQVDGEFERLAEKYKRNDQMREMLGHTRQSWDAYRNVQCMFEGMASAGGQTVRPMPVEANKVFLKCIARTLSEMQAALGKF
jgi:uncharacterized protein YecT (DUF1311 family)